MSHVSSWRTTLWFAISLVFSGCSGVLVIEDPSNVPCEDDADCGTGFVCNDVGVCVPSEGPCSLTLPEGDCPTGRICFGGICGCPEGDNDCECPDGVCISIGPSWCQDCAVEQGCADGACTAITVDNACSASKLDGLCADSEVCVGGHCVPIDDQNTCSPDRPLGLCRPGLSCVSGYCLPIGDRPCSDTRPQGLCPAGQTCGSDGSAFTCGVQSCGTQAPYGVCGGDERCLEGTCEDLACGPYHSPGGVCLNGSFCSVTGTCIDDGLCLDDGDCSETTYCIESAPRACLPFGRCATDPDCERQPDPFGQGFECDGGRCEERETGCVSDTDCVDGKFCSELNNCLELPACDGNTDCDSTEKCSSTTPQRCIPADKCLDDDDCLAAQFCSTATADGYRLCLPDDSCGDDPDCPPGHICNAPNCEPGGDLCLPSATLETAGGCGNLYCCSTGDEGNCCPAGQKCSNAGSCISGRECVTVADCLTGYFFCDLDYTCQPLPTLDCSSSPCTNPGDFCSSEGNCLPAGACVTDSDCAAGERCNQQYACEADPGCFNQDLSIGTAVPPNVLIVVDRSASMQLCAAGDPLAGFCGQPADDGDCCEASGQCNTPSDCDDLCLDGTCSTDSSACSDASTCGGGTCDGKVCSIGGGACAADGDCSLCNFCVCPGFGNFPPCDAGAPGICNVTGGSCLDDGDCAGAGVCSAPACNPGSADQPTRWQQAVQAVKDLMAAQTGKVNFGLAMYPQAPDVCDCVGPQPCAVGGTCRRGGAACDNNADCDTPGTCDTDCNWFSCSDKFSTTAGGVDVDVAPGSQSDIERLLDAAVPGGSTPTAPTLRAVLADAGLAGLDADDRANAVLLVTDGEAIGDSQPGGVCEPACGDAVRNGLESDVDCGGLCPRCIAGDRCDGNDDCLSGFCPAGSCRPDHCANGVADSGSNETDVDCGGPCEPCDTGSLCTTTADCRGTCDTGAGTCVASSCSDGRKTGDEAGVDCGSACADAPCAAGESCTGGDGSACTTTVCQADLCRPAHCDNDGADAGDGETGEDCGGPCEPCADGLGCGDGDDCTSGFCNASNLCETLELGASDCIADAECLSGTCRLCAQCSGGDNEGTACAEDSRCTGGGTCSDITNACNVNSSLDQLYIQEQAIKTFVVGFAFAGVSENLNCATAHGHTGRRDRCADLDASNCDSQATECYYTAENQADLNSAFDSIVSEVTSCTFHLNQTPAEPGQVSAFFDTDVGAGRNLVRSFKFLDWIYSAPTNQIEFIGNACTRIQNGEVEPVVILACSGGG